jgi:predicted Zn-dependent protease with MMP-like domain
MRTSEFEKLVMAALGELPATVHEMLENIDIVIQLWPTREQLMDNELTSKYEMLGLYEGVPLTERGSGYSMVLPDRITIFQGVLEAAFRRPEELIEEIRITVIHELAHHFGWSDGDLHEMGY